MKTRNCIAFVIVALTGVFQLGVLPASRADMTTTTETRVFLEKDRVEFGSKVRYARGQDERVENHSKLAGVPMDETTINLCQANQQITLDERFLIYHERSFMQDGNSVADEKAKSDAIATQDFPADKTGSEVVTYQITPIGEEVIAGINSKGYLIKGHIEKTGCALTAEGESEKDFKSELWFGDKDKVLNCFEAKIGDAFKETQLDEKRFEIVDGCKISYETKSNSDVIEKNFDKLVMRTKAYRGDKVWYSEEITKISEDKIDDALFNVPSFAKKMDIAEYDNARQQAVRQAMVDAKAADAEEN